MFNCNSVEDSGSIMPCWHPSSMGICFHRIIFFPSQLIGKQLLSVISQIYPEFTMQSLLLEKIYLANFGLHSKRLNAKSLQCIWCSVVRKYDLTLRYYSETLKARENNCGKSKPHKYFIKLFLMSVLMCDKKVPVYVQQEYMSFEASFPISSKF